MLSKTRQRRSFTSKSKEVTAMLKHTIVLCTLFLLIGYTSATAGQHNIDLEIQEKLFALNTAIKVLGEAQVLILEAIDRSQNAPPEQQFAEIQKLNETIDIYNTAEKRYAEADATVLRLADIIKKEAEDALDQFDAASEDTILEAYLEAVRTVDRYDNLVKQWLSLRENYIALGKTFLYELEKRDGTPWRHA